jgi:hypothetical protein
VLRRGTMGNRDLPLAASKKSLRSGASLAIFLGI